MEPPFIVAWQASTSLNNGSSSIDHDILGVVLRLDIMSGGWLGVVVDIHIYHGGHNLVDIIEEGLQTNATCSGTFMEDYMDAKCKETKKGHSYRVGR
jgi:hypothetical protein